MWSHDGRAMWIAGPHGAIRALDVATAEVNRTLGSTAASAPEPFLVWDAIKTTLTLLSRRAVPLGERGKTTSLVWNPAGCWLAAKQGNPAEPVIALWDVETKAKLFTIPGSPNRGFASMESRRQASGHA